MSSIFLLKRKQDEESFISIQGRFQDSNLEGGGGAQKIIGAHAHYERETRGPFRQGSTARWRALEALGGGGGVS